MPMIREGWEPPNKHHCEPPFPHPTRVPTIQIGSVWSCDVCCKQWLAVIGDHGHVRWRRKWRRIPDPTIDYIGSSR